MQATIKGGKSGYYMRSPGVFLSLTYNIIIITPASQQHSCENGSYLLFTLYKLVRYRQKTTYHRELSILRTEDRSNATQIDNYPGYPTSSCLLQASPNASTTTQTSNSSISWPSFEI